MYCTLRCLTSWPVPLVSRLTTLFLKSRSLSRSIFGSPNSTPHAFACRDFVDAAWRRAAAPSTECSRDRRRRRRDSASGSMSATLEPEIGGQKRGGVAARAAADDDELS